MNLAALGPEGTFSHELAVALSPDVIFLLPTIRRVFEHVAESGCDGIVPVENSEAGSVGVTMDCLLEFPVVITGEVYMPVNHHFVSHYPPEEVRRLYAHPQAHEQCSSFIETLGAEVIHTASNAASVCDAQGVGHAGAITTMAAARLYDMPIRRENVQNSPDNVTRFVRISGALSQDRPDAADKCSIVADPGSERPGLLYNLLSVFAEQGINLTRIESRPSKRGIGTYIFFIDFQTPDSCERTASVISALRERASIRELGCYDRLEVRGWK